MNSQNSNNFFKYKTRESSGIDVTLLKPVALLDDNSYDMFDTQILTINASSSYDPNNLTLVNYEVYKNNTLIVNSSVPVFDVNGFDLNIGANDLELFVENELGVRSDAYNFEVEVDTFFKSSSFRLDVAALISNGEINFDIEQLVDFDDKRVSLRPQIECIGIDFDYYKSVMDTGLVLNDTNETFSLSVDRQDFDLNVPLNNNCQFRVYLIDDDTGNEILLVDNVTFTDIAPASLSQDFNNLNHGVDVSSYIFQSLNTQFDRGYNTLSFNLRNDGASDIKADFGVSIPELGLDYTDTVTAYANADRQVSIPLYISDSIKPRTYPVRISYRINDGELKVRYGYIVIE